MKKFINHDQDVIKETIKKISKLKWHTDIFKRRKRSKVQNSNHHKGSKERDHPKHNTMKQANRKRERDYYQNTVQKRRNCNIWGEGKY